MHSVQIRSCRGSLSQAQAGSDQKGLFSPSLIPGAKERAHEQKKHSSFEDELSEVLEKHNSQAELKGQCCQSGQRPGEGGDTNST